MLVHALFYILLIAISIQDFRSRKVYFFLFPLAFISLLWSQSRHYNWHVIFTNFLYNIILIFMLLSLMIFYYMMKREKMKEIFTKKIGVGDILFFLIPALSFSPLNYILFLTGCFLLVLIISLLFRPVRSSNIPLAGYMACILLIFDLFCNFIYKVNLYRDFNIL